ncbi:MAG: protein BatD, partial [Gammaproteobacteria bacterium]|nr:protein BatD [Gammaproteobacteria bacterium]
MSATVSADITASVDRPVISDEDTFSLRLTIAGKGSGGEPDLAPLRKDFEVLGTGKSSRINIINGRMESRTEWKITLAPRHDGEIVIPAIEVGGDKSQPLMIKVLKASQASAGRSQDLFLEVEAGPTAPYVQSQVTYTVRLFFREISEGQLYDPEPVNALVRRIGEDVSYTAQRNNQSYRVIERRYAIFPQASGRLTVPAPMFSGKVPDGTRRQHSLFDGLGSFDQFFRNTRAVRRRGEPIT